MSRDEALADLLANPAGSLRDWARRWGWSLAKVQRYVAWLEKNHVMTFERSTTGTCGKSVSGVSASKEDKCIADDTLNAESSATTAGSVSLSRYSLDKLQVPRYERSLESDALILALNAGLSVALGSQFKAIKSDNRGSIQAAGKILAKVPLERAVDLIGQAGRIFNPSNSGGKMPRSLGHPFFTRYVFNESKRIERNLAKEQFELLPEIEMSVSSTVSRPTVAPVVAPDGEPAPTPFSRGKEIFAAAFEEAQRARAAK